MARAVYLGSRARRIARLLLALPPRFAHWLWSLLCRAIAWVGRELVSPVACLLAIYVGVCFTMLLPASMWSLLAHPALTQVIGAPITVFPLAELPDQTILLRGLLAAIPLAIQVFATGAYQEWKESKELLGARLIYACQAGISWPKSWWRGFRQKAKTPPATPLAP